MTLADLNPPQREAVTHLDGPLLVLAGAGTGKTRVITYRMAEIIRRGTPPDRILSVTFTNKAAREMLERTTALLGRRPKSRPWISTFHSLCVRLLRQEAQHLGYPPSFAIFDRADQEAAARTALRETRLGDTAMKPGDLLSRISRWKMNGVAPDRAAEHTEDDKDLLAAVAYRRYQNALRTAAAVDFDDLLLLTHHLLEERPDLREKHQSRFDYVQIDEYQDTNRVQFKIVEALVEGHNRICVVGDDDQSIYGWRGAEVEHILNFQSHFPGAKVVRLEDNYRCTDRILALANNLVRYNRARHPKALRTTKRSSDAVRFLEFPDEVTEAEQVVLEIDYLVKQKYVKPGEIAILYRTNEQPRVFESELRRRRVPYVLVGGQSFFDYKEVRDLLSYLRAVVNPNDDYALLRIVNVPARGVGAATVEKVVARSVRARTTFWQAEAAMRSAGELPAKAAEGLESLRRLLEKYRRMTDEKPKQLDAITAGLIEELNYEEEIRRNYKEPGQQLSRSAMLDQLTDALKEYCEREADSSLAGFLQETTLGGKEDQFEPEDKTPKEGIRLMTLHSAKGLEFPRVYLVGMEENILPHHRSVAGTPAMIEEERRLAYVGVTRAQDHLTLTRAAARKKWGKLRPTTPSRFLQEMRGDEQPVLPAETDGEEKKPLAPTPRAVGPRPQARPA
jgi:DNA helicase-2/ATP-dependent DNA helicase PcrA